MCIMQRLIAAIGSWFPVYDAPRVYALASSAIDAVCCAVFVLPIFRNIIRSDGMRMAMCILMAVEPRATELVGTVVNMQWYLLVAGTLFVFRGEVHRGESQPANWVRAVECTGWGILGAFLALEMPVLTVCVPFCLWNAIRKWRPDRVFEIGLIAGLALQCWLFWKSGQPTGDLEHFARLDMLAASVIVGFVYRIVMSSLAGYNLAMIPAAGKWMTVPLAALIATVIWLTVLWLKSDRNVRWKIGIALYLAFSSMAATLGPRNMFAVFSNINAFVVIQLDRYLFLASCIFIFLAAISIERLFKGKRTSFRVGALLAALALGAALNYHIPRFPDLNWKASAQLIQERLDRHQIGPGYPKIVAPISPDGWSIYLE